MRFGTGYNRGMKLSCRAFLGSLAAASSVAVAGGVLGVFADRKYLDRNLRRQTDHPDQRHLGCYDTYFMRPGEVLRGLHLPGWSRIVLADRCQVIGCAFHGTQIEIPIGVEECLIANCSLSGLQETATVFNLVSGVTA